ncbi:putative secreted protein [Mycolicibacterium sp. BK634]|uniref:hypothetical protein n=1 Tax=Mycolicibacterium sp. BK634 TaxID=2587099 RepID=UPI00161527E5|nr:hypothetical protein [Mycolicibacterium sp. BK634]MBB3752516.1 putative secreted protein [Mycolicibacterium sp. BK634]
MSGWTYDVTISKVKRKTKRVQIRAYSREQAIEYAKDMTEDKGWEESRTEMEYDARELD